MASYRLTDRAKADAAAIMRTSQRRHGREARIRYRALLSAAMRRVAAEPEGLSTAGHSELMPGLRSFHIRHARTQTGAATVKNPVHIIFYRIVAPGRVEIVRILHERMEPGRHLQ
jgi:toxin ParE1/3/4